MGAWFRDDGFFKKFKLIKYANLQIVRKKDDEFDLE